MSNNPLPKSSSAPVKSSTTQTPSLPFQTDGLIKQLMSPNVLMLLGALVVWWWLSRNSDSKGKLAKGKWGGAVERKAAKNLGKKQVNAPKKNACALYVNKPQYIRDAEEGKGDKKKPNKFLIAGKYSLPEPSDEQKKEFKAATTIWMPEAQTSTVVMGKAGSGKTYTWIEPFLRSALDQGFSALVYDFKDLKQAEVIALYAIRRGYTIHYFAPGYEITGCFNPLDSIEHSSDGVNAQQLAKVLVKNSGKPGDSGDPFFEGAGESLVEGLFLMTKWINEYLQSQGETERWDDLLTTACLVGLPNLAARLQYAIQNPKYKLSRWTIQPLIQLLSTHGSGAADAEANKTETSIVATAIGVFGQFIKRDFVGAFCQESNIPIDIDGKTLVIVGMKQSGREAIAPVIATAMHLLISHNIRPSQQRVSPLVVGLDELPSLYLPNIANWLAEARSAGFTALIGIQTYTQLVLKYGEELANIIFTNCSNKITCDPGNVDSAKMMSEYIGEEEVIVTNTSRSSGKNGSTTTSKNAQAVSMVSTNELLTMKRGSSLAIFAGSENAKSASVPQKLTVKISAEDMYEVDYLKGKWDEYYAKVAKQTPQLSDDELEKLFAYRVSVIEAMFPEPPAPPK
jgi:type IV secretory pathway TraG/TraD family ATPase VirD4